MKIVVYLIFFIVCIFCNEEEDIKIDILKDPIKMKLDMKSRLIPPNPNIGITETEMNQIKERAKNYEVTPATIDDVVIINTSHGTLKLILYPDKAPHHCNNFKKLANSGFYDNTLFHRVVPGFIIQGGDILSRDGNPANDGTGNPGWIINEEFNDIKHTRGVLSMARGGDINSAGSQFFICVADAKHLDNNYSAFGKVIGKEKVLDIITSLPSEAKQVLRNSRQEIPENSLNEEWLEYIYGGKKFFIKIPSVLSKEVYEKEVKEKLKNKHRPHVPIIIRKIRVVDSKELLVE